MSNFRGKPFTDLLTGAGMSKRRFTNKPTIAPDDVLALSPTHPALVENRTLFPSTVVTVTESEPARLPVSGQNNRKLGSHVEKGALKGAALYGLSLEERATCPVTCDVRAQCYGNGMQMARRHRIGDAEVFYARLEAELAALIAQHGTILVRLHVLGDFPSEEYVAFWKDMLDEMPGLSIYGYSHRLPKSDPVGDAIQAVKDVHPDRFRIRERGQTKGRQQYLTSDTRRALGSDLAAHFVAEKGADGMYWIGERLPHRLPW